MMKSQRFRGRTASLFLIFLWGGFVTLAPTRGFAQEGEDALPETSEVVATEAGEITDEEPSGIGERLNNALKKINVVLEKFLFFDLARGRIKIESVDREGNPIIDEDTGEVGEAPVKLPFIVMILAGGALFFTVWYRFINFRGFKHSIDVIRGKFDNPDDRGEISHFRALTSALSATVGLGNIAGVAIAIRVGGPGATFWMVLVALFGMSSKFSSCTLAQLYRQYNPDGTISGGPMYYLDLGLKAKGAMWAPIGKVLAIMYAFMVMGGAIGGGNMFQANQSFEALYSTFSFIDGGEGAAATHSYIFGIIMSIMVALVVLGGIRRIGAATSKIVPTMCGLYVLACLYIIVRNIGEVPAALSLIFKMAFTGNAFFGGLIGVLVTGVQRASFSNEAGLGSAAIAHAAAKTEEPVREGMVAMIGPFIDTCIVCLMTASVIVITGAWNDPALTESAGVAITTEAFRSGASWFPYILTLCILLFAYSTMISWCYYGERGWIYLLDHFNGSGLRTLTVFRIVFVLCVFIGAVADLGPVLSFTDMMILSMAFPNIVGSIMLAPEVLKKVQDYWGRYTSGEMKPTS